MSDISSKPLPDWWQRERQTRQIRILLLLVFLLGLIAYFYWVSAYGVIGGQGGIPFDTSNHVSFIHVDEKGNPSLYAIRSDGTDIRRLTLESDKSNKQNPMWSADGKTVFYSSTNNPNQVMQIYIMGSGGAKQLTYGTGNKFSPTPVLSSNLITFLTQGAVKTVLTNGEDVHQVMPLPHAGHSEGGDEAMSQQGELKGPYLWAEYSPAGESLAAIQSLSSEDNPHNMGAFSAGDQVIRAIVKGKDAFLDSGREVGACWEPKGKRLLGTFAEYHIPKDSDGKPSKDAPPEYQLPQFKDVDIVSGMRIFNLEDGKQGSKPIFLAFGYTLEPRNPTWSPDGILVAFEVWVHKKGGEKALKGISVLDVSKDMVFAIRSQANMDEFKTMLPATSEGSPMHPVFSPDGARILFELAKAKGGRDICVVNTDGTGFKNLTLSLGGENSQAVWAPLKKQ